MSLLLSSVVHFFFRCGWDSMSTVAVGVSTLVGWDTSGLCDPSGHVANGLPVGGRVTPGDVSVTPEGGVPVIEDKSDKVDNIFSDTVLLRLEATKGES